jgi:hypothetical protein
MDTYTLPVFFAPRSVLSFETIQAFECVLSVFIVASLAAIMILILQPWALLFNRSCSIAKAFP